MTERLETNHIQFFSDLSASEKRCVVVVVVLLSNLSNLTKIFFFIGYSFFFSFSFFYFVCLLVYLLMKLKKVCLVHQHIKNFKECYQEV